MSNNITKLLESLIDGGGAGASLQGLEQVCADILNSTLATAVGARLTTFARLVGQPHNGLDDDTLRAYTRARIQAHRSKGSAEGIIRVGKLVVNDPAAYIHLQPEGPATLRLFVENIVLTNDLAAIVYLFAQTAAAAGVRLIVQWTSSAFANAFRYDSGPGFDQGHLSGDQG